MKTLKVKTKIIDVNINTPKLSYAKEGDAGIDLTATSKWYDEHGNVCFGTNRAFEIPKGYVGLLFPRSSNAGKQIILSNSVGVIDSGYRGEVMLKFKSTVRVLSFGSLLNIMYYLFGKVPKKINVKNYYGKSYEIGDKVGQIIILPYPKIEFEESEELSETERNTGGYGSTGN